MILINHSFSFFFNLGKQKKGLYRFKRDDDLTNLKKIASKKPTQSESKFKSSNVKLLTNLTQSEPLKSTTTPTSTPIPTPTPTFTTEDGEDGFLNNFTAPNATIDVSLNGFYNSIRNNKSND